MANIERLICTWRGGLGLPGYSTFYAVPGAGHQADYAAFLSGLAAGLPSGVTIEVPNTGDVIDDATGTLVGTWSGGTTTVVTGGAAGGYAAGIGVCVNWQTGGIVAGKRVRGRTFLCPVASGQFAADGSLTPAAQADYVTRVGALLTALGGDGLIWSRPRPALAGSSHPIVGFNVPDRPSALRSRYR